MGKILQFPGGAEIINEKKNTVSTIIAPSKPKEDFYFNIKSRRILEEKILQILSNKRLMFISTILKKIEHTDNSKVFVILGNLERRGKIEQLEVQGENQRIKGYFRLKE